MTTALAPWKACFTAMGCPCEVLVDTADPGLGRRLAAAAEAEARRVEAKFSRYRADSVVSRLNASNGRPVAVDEETALLLDFAAECWRLSDGLFDVTTGVLRRAWRFEPGAAPPSDRAVEEARALVGWDKAEWSGGALTLRPGMEVDLGGLGKEYAADRALALLRAESDEAVLVNVGGDIAARGPRRGGEPWLVGIERAGTEGEASRVVGMTRGGLTTSGDTKRCLEAGGRRYGHILDPRTGRPVEGAPRSVTVAAGSCTEAGFLSTAGMLMGRDAERWLAESGARFWTAR